MGFFSNKINGLFKGAKKMTSKTFLDAAAGICVATGFADGNLDDMETATMTVLMQNDDMLSSYSESEIESAIEKNVAKFNMNKMIAEMAVTKACKALEDQEQKEMAVALAVAVAGADGNIDKDEIATIKKFAKEVGVNPSKFGI